LTERGGRGRDLRPELADVERWAAAAAGAAAAKTDDEVVVLRVGAVLGLTELFVICNGRNSRQVKAVADEVEARVDAVGGPKPTQVEGLDGLRWVLMDYGGFVVHVFLDEVRQFYELERLWSDVPRVDWRRLGPIDAVAE
jgi:ribosome-associated protein